MSFRKITAYIKTRLRKEKKGKYDKEKGIHKPEQPLTNRTEKENVPMVTSFKGDLRPEEEKFNCQTRIQASEVKYSMVTTVTESWEQDLKTIPNWERIGGEILLRK
jgi:hypothetical protein